ncbi:helix-turn-helix transcriptional regulator [uncultured Ilumatobacter sp.]|jgi:predicted ArsR family transcriptional regulator|uniref:helix-turn-helix transcriptional regulator n=1 Tax=Ilumatobacter sp. TaxID=1967498 RepID=UPI0030A8D455|tara:strand:- start:2515 stop:3156 length:642 start_codon:yes stop_codon:yes gene_type:complete
MKHAVDLSPTQRHVLEILKRHGEATPDELAIALEISSSAVRQHLGALRTAGLVTSHKDHGHPGRPAERYRATTLTEPLFATAAESLPIELLGHMEAEEPALIGRVFDRRRHQMVDVAERRLAGKPVAEQVAILTELLDEQGHLADFEAVAEGHFRINLHNCAIWAVANQYPQACASELDYLRDLIPEANVQRITHKTSGAHTCAYDIHLDADT